MSKWVKSVIRIWIGSWVFQFPFCAFRLPSCWSCLNIQKMIFISRLRFYLFRNPLRIWSWLILQSNFLCLFCFSQLKIVLEHTAALKYPQLKFDICRFGSTSGIGSNEIVFWVQQPLCPSCISYTFQWILYGKFSYQGLHQTTRSSNQYQSYSFPSRVSLTQKLFITWWNILLLMISLNFQKPSSNTFLRLD